MWDVSRHRRHLDDIDRHFLSQAFRIFLVASALVVTIVGFALHAALYSDGRQVASASGAASAAMARFSAVDQLASAAAHVAAERGLVYTALVSGRPLPDAQRAQLDTHRREAKKAFDGALEQARAPGLAGSGNALLGLTLARDRLDEMRAHASARLNGPHQAADQALARSWFIESSRLLARTEGFVDHLQAVLPGPAGSQGQALLQLQRLALAVAIAAGRERAAVSAALASSSPVPARIPNLDFSDGRRRIEMSWREIRQMADVVAAPELDALIERIERTYFGDIRDARHRLTQLSNSGAMQPSAATAWFERMSAAIDQFVALGRTAGRMAQQRWTQPQLT